MKMTLRGLSRGDHCFFFLGLVLALASLWCGGCATAIPARSEPLQTEALHHIIRVNAAGELLQLDGRLAQEGYAEKNLIGPLREADFGPAGRYSKGVLVFIHGGLNTYEQAYEHFRCGFAGLEAEHYYPLFLVWPSGLGSTYWEHLAHVRQGRREEGPVGRPFAAATLPLVLLQDLITGFARTPMTTLQTLGSDFATAVPPNWGTGKHGAVEICRDLTGDNARVRIGVDYKTESAMALRTASYWLTLPTKIATAGPVIDTFGRPAWDDMLRRTYMVFPGSLADHRESAPSPFEMVVTETPAPAAGLRASVAGASRASRVKRQEEVRNSGFGRLILALEVLQAGRPFPVTLVGHSMGAIVVNHVLEATTLEVKRIVYLAAACSVREYSEAVLPYLARHPEAQSYNLSLHPMAEDGEWQSSLYDIAPRGSLLVWIDNFLSNPVSEQDRTFGRWTNLFLQSPTGNPAIVDILLHRDAGERIHFRAFDVGAGDKPRAPNYQWSSVDPATHVRDKNSPETHGNMAGIPFWDDAVLTGAP